MLQRIRYKECQSRYFRAGALGGQQNGVERDSVVFKSDTWDQTEEWRSVVVGLALPIRDADANGPRFGEAVGRTQRDVFGPVAPGIVIDAGVTKYCPARCRCQNA